MENAHDWLSRLLEMMPVKGTVDYRCFLGVPWRIDFPATEFGEIPYHVIPRGSAVLEASEGGPTRKLVAGDILLFPMDRRMRSTTRAMRRRHRPVSKPRSRPFSTRMTEPSI